MSVLADGHQAGYVTPSGEAPRSLWREPPASEAEEPWRESALQSPFSSGLMSLDESGVAVETVAEVLDHLADEDFADALEDLIDEAASRHLADQGAWSVPPTPGEAQVMLQQWLEPLAGEAERAIDGLGAALEGTDLVALGDTELEGLLASAAVPPVLGNEVFDQFLGGLVKKAAKVVGGAVSLVKKGVALAGKLSPVGLLLGKLKGLIRPLLNRVIGTAIAQLPEALRPVARKVAEKLGLPVKESADAVSGLAEDFDDELTALLLAPDGDTSAELEDEAEDLALAAERLDELDQARVRLAHELVELPPGTAPVAEIEQFVPIAMAVKPLVKLGIKVIGRDRVVGFIAKGIAELIRGLVGPGAAAKLSRPLVDVGLRALGFEASPTAARDLPGEALAQTVEGTVLRLMEMPVETFSDELQLGAALQQAFTESAAAFMPDRLLQADLPERETAEEGGSWVLMPRAARPHYRFRRYTKVFTLPVTRQVARAVPWSDGGTLESYLLDRGATSWPVLTEVGLYEAMPGTHMGHLVAVEGEGEADPAEFQDLTPEIAGLLLREPALGRRVPGPRTRPRRPRPGQRMFRIRPVGLRRSRRVRRPRRRVLVWLDANAATPRLSVVLRLTERQAQQVLHLLEPGKPGGVRNLPGVLKALRGHYATVLPALVTQRLARGTGGTGGAVGAPSAGGAVGAPSAPTDPAAPATPAAAEPTASDGPATASEAGSAAAGGKVTAAVTAALSAFLSQRATAFAAAVRNPADGVSVKVTFPGVTRQSIDGDLPAGVVSVEPGWPRRD